MPLFSDNPMPSFLLAEQGSTPASPATGDQRIFFKTSDHLPYLVNHAGTVTAVGGAGSAITTGKASRSTDNSMASANAFYDGASITPAAGTYAIWGRNTVVDSVNPVHITTILTDGTTNFDSAQATSDGGSWCVCPTVYAVVTSTGVQTYKVRSASNGVNGTIKAACPQNGVGNTASTLFYCKLA